MGARAGVVWKEKLPVKYGNAFCLFAVFAAVCFRAGAADPAAIEHFEKSVRPILAEHCYSCHGAEKQKASLRVDHISFLLTGGDTGPALVPGDTTASRFAQAVSYKDVDLQMPPKGKLSDEQIATLTQWIADGAIWPEEAVPMDGAPPPAMDVFDLEQRRAEHWAWQPIQQPELPAVQDSAWPRNGIDHFILSRLEQEGFAPAGEADRRTLIRRLSFDLTGLPPTPESVEAFVSDTREDAYERLVDTLLASPDFGERWGRHWLDITRYAETFGHEQDYPIEYAWKYRDYVINALNADLPYDQLVREHIAGDLLPSPRVNVDTGVNESLAATGFWYMHQATHAPVDVRLDQNDRIDNQIDVFSKAFLGMTVSCARCHDHKFDAISMADYYALAGFMKSSRQQHAYLDPTGAISEGTERLQRATERIERTIKESFTEHEPLSTPVFPYLMASAQLKSEAADAASVASQFGLDAARLQSWMDSLSNASVNEPSHPLYLWTRAVDAGTPDSAWFASLATELNGLAEREPAPSDAVVYETFDASTGYGRWTAYGEAFGAAPTGDGAWMEDAGRIELLPPGVAHSGVLDSKLEGTLRSPDFVIEHDSLHYLAAGTGGEVRLIIEGYELRDYNGLLFEATFLPINHGREYRWQHQVSGIAKFKGRTAFIEIVDTGDHWIAVDEIRFSDAAPASVAPPTLARQLLGTTPPASLMELASRYVFAASEAMAAWNAGEASREQQELINTLSRGGLLSLRDHSRHYAKALEAKQKIASDLPRAERLLAITEGTPTDEVLMLRGNYKTPGEPVKRRFLEAVAGPEVTTETDGSGRLYLAERVLAEDNPLTARVMANRVWHYLMGRGIVPSVDNFGVLGQAPSHPELLDYLAQEFRANDWSVKRLIRDVVTSQTYRMSSAPADQSVESRDPDNILLHRMNRRRLEGEAIRDAILQVAGTLNPVRFGPSVPAYISPFVEGNRRPEKSGPADGDRRRSIYLEVRRNYMPPMLQAFDMPVPDTTQGRRNVSNVPAQALILMNDPFVIEQAAAWAKDLIAQAETIEDRISRLYRTALGRTATAEETARMQAFIHAQAAVYGLNATDAPDDERVWADLCHVMFTLKEFIFVA